MSFEVTVTPTVYNVEVEVNPSVEPFDVQVITQQDLADLVEEAKQYAEDAEDSADSASASASSATASATTATNQANIATNQALLASAARLNAQNAANDAEDSADASALSASSALASATSAELDAIATASDRVQTGLDRQATGADRVQTGLDRVATGADRVQTGIDANTASTQAGVATTQAGIATTQAGIATTQAGNALTSANDAEDSANAAAASAASAAQVGTSTLLTGFTTGANTTILGTDTILGAFQKAQGQINARVSGTGVAGQVSFWTGTGTQSGDTKLTFNSSTGLLTLDGDLTLTGAQTIQTSTGNLTIATGGGNGNIFITPNGTGQVIIGNNDTNTQYALLGASIGRRLVFENFVNNSRNNAGHRINASDSSGALSLATVGTDRLFIQSNGNVGINTTTDSGFRLDVNGTARVQSNLTVTATNATGDFATIDGSNILRRRTAAQVLTDIGAQATLTNPVTGTGASGQVAFWSGTGSQTGDSGLTWDNTNKSLALQPVATTQPRFFISHIDSSTTFAGTNQQAVIRITNTDLTNNNFSSIQSNSGGLLDSIIGFRHVNHSLAYGDIFFGTRGAGGFGARMVINSAGNVLIGTSVDAGFRFDVNGTARVQGALTTNLTAGSVPFIGASGLLTQDGSNLFWDNTNKRLGVGTNVIDAKFQVFETGAGNMFVAIQKSDTTAGNSVNLDFTVAPSYVPAITNYGGRLRYTRTGANGVGNWDIMSADSTGAPISRFRIFNGGNVLIQNGGTFTDAGFRLDVNGTARVQGDFTLTGGSNVVLATATGTRIGTATNQLLSLWNATPIVQPTTSVAGATRVGGGGTTLTDTDTFDGYTLAQIVRGLRNFGAFA
jgi:hypothetical protein